MSSKAFSHRDTWYRYVERFLAVVDPEEGEDTMSNALDGGYFGIEGPV